MERIERSVNRWEQLGYSCAVMFVWPPLMMLLFRDAINRPEEVVGLFSGILIQLSESDIFRHDLPIFLKTNLRNIGWGLWLLVLLIGLVEPFHRWRWMLYAGQGIFSFLNAFLGGVYALRW